MPRKWILVIDDDARLRGQWVAMLEAEGYAAVGCGDGLAAGELIRAIFPDLILLDLRMPRMSGWEFLELVRAHPRWKEIPFLVVSGFLDDDRPLAGAGLNILGTMRKPVNPDELLAKVGEAVGPVASLPTGLLRPRL